MPLSPSEFRTKLTKADFKSLEALERRGNRRTTSGEVLQFRPRRRKWRSWYQRWRMPAAVSLVIALAGGAGIGSLIFDLRPQSLSFGGTGPCRWGFQRTCVIDGDTVRYQGEKIRLAGIDTPEIFSPKCPSELELGRKAKQRLVDLLNAGPFDVTPTAGPDEDIYGRRLRVILRNGRSVGDTLVAEGLARRWLGSRLSWC